MADTGSASKPHPCCLPDVPLNATRHESISPDETLDVLCNEKVRLIQKKKGYRLSMDPLLLANFVTLKLARPFWT